ncbi:MAG: membrane integrity-associated transporter subunit PqiC [Candidatus Hydrogenedentes bacterium]|nr:membrane integrity-associated transporter subunit PqiC [Candidatus Hydrogenedentota bacterium]
MNRLANVLVAAVLITGCVSAPPPQYFTLNMEPSGKARAEKNNLDVDHLLPAEALIRNQILIKKNPTEIEYYKRAMWAERVDAVVREKLEAEFGPKNDSRPTFILSGDLLAFEQLDTEGGADAHIKMALEFRPAGSSRYDKPTFSKTYEIRVTAKTRSPGAVVEALSQGVEQIAAQIVADGKAL